MVQIASLRDLRIKAGYLTQEKAAEVLCIARNTLSRWETGARTPSLKDVTSLAQIYGVTADEIIKALEGIPAKKT